MSRCRISLTPVASTEPPAAFARYFLTPHGLDLGAAARLYGLFPRKGTIAIGADADLAIWNPERTVRVTWDRLHDNVGYTPYEGREITGWPEIVVSRGRVVVEDGDLNAERGSGDFLRCDRSSFARPLGRLEPEMDPARNGGARF